MTVMKKSSVWVALLGVAIGALSVLCAQKISPRGKMKVSGGDWSKLSLVLRSLEENYVDTIDYSKVSEAAIAAALQSLDPHSYYMEPRSLEEHEEELAANFDGIGIQFNVPNDTAVVIEVIPGGPSEKVGLQSGDKLLKVDDTPIAGVKFPQDSMVRRIKGKAGSKVRLSIQRGKEIIPFEITRGKIPTHSVDAAFMVSDSVAYLRLSKFSRTTAKEMLENGIKLKGEGMKEMILDLRDNTGGFMDQALSLSNLFLEKGDTIVYMEGLHRKKEEYLADGRGPFKDIRLKVLIDENTASSSEIVAGALQDNHRATIIGRRSFGKGLVQEPFYFTDGSGMRITVARFYTPSGRCIQKPYSEDYNYEVYKRYSEGEMVVADSMKVENGGILPDVFVAMDTTKAGKFYMDCSRKATTMRFASDFFERHRDRIASIASFGELDAYLNSAPLEKEFLAFALNRDSLKPSEAEWKKDGIYLMTQVKALVGRYSLLSENAYYHIYLAIDTTFNKALEL